MFYQKSDDGYHSRIKGIDQKTLVYGERTLLAEFHLKKGSVVPAHAHPNEQTGYLVSGRMVFTLGGRQYDTQAGDSWCIAAGAEHSAEVIEDSVAVEIFSPLREDYLPERKF
ncbi:MAG: cupin domain-containing protein [Deltaproteobacteria bacterium]